jgi:hypothetical protein
MTKTISGDEYINVTISKSQVHFKRVKNPKGADQGIGNYFMLLDVTSKKGTVLIPVSIASSKKVTGFAYQIEGTATGSLSTAEVSVRGDGVTQVTLGTLLYCKIEEEETASFRAQVEIKGKIGKEYTVVIHQINYKLNATDARYKKFTGTVSSRTLEFK